MFIFKFTPYYLFVLGMISLIIRDFQRAEWRQSLREQMWRWGLREWQESPKSATTKRGSESDGELPVLQRNFLHPDIPIWRLTSWAPVRAVADGSADVVTSSHPSPCNTSSIWMFSRTDNEDDLTVSLASADWPQQLPQLCWIVQTARKVERSLLREEIYRVLDFLGNASWR